MTTPQTIATNPSAIRAKCQKCQELTATVTRLQRETKLLQDLLTSAVGVIKTIEPESVEEGAMLDTLVAFSNAVMRVPPYDDLFPSDQPQPSQATDWSAA